MVVLLLSHFAYAQQDDLIIVSQIEPDSQRGSTSQAFFEQRRDDFAVISLSGDYNRNRPDGSFNIVPRMQVANSFYSAFTDEFDFLVVFSTFEFETGNAQAFFHGVRNDIQGIGVNQFDNGVLYDSPARLQGYIDMAAFTRYELDPYADNYREVLATLSHEVMHRWSQGIDYQSASGAVSTNLRGLEGAHWPVFSDTQASVMGGADWRNNGDGTHTALAAFRGYSDFDLYLAGFLPADPGLSQDIISATGNSDRLYPNLQETISGGRETISVNQIIAANGPRIPAGNSSQKQFRLGFILLQRPGQEIPDALLQALDNVRRDFPTRFAAQTGGQAVAHTYLIEPGQGMVGEPDSVIDTTGQGVAFDPELAADWLIAQQSVPGYWQDKQSTRIRDTSSATRFVNRLRPVSSAWVTGRDWLAEQRLESTDLLIWQNATGLLPTGTPSEPGIARLITRELRIRQNDDGGWGLENRFASSPYDTALLLLLAGDSLQNGGIQRALSYLLSQRNTDFSWSSSSGGAGEVLTTAIVIDALKASLSAADLSDSVQWLAATRHADGGFGESASNVVSTVAVANALTGLLASDDPVFVAAADYLANRQQADGHWESSVYSTAVAADFLITQGKPNLLWQSVQVEPTQVVTGQPVVINASVKNNGATATPASDASLLDSSGELIVGPLTIPALAPDASVAVTFTRNTGELSGASQVTLVVDSADAINEVSEADNQVIAEFEVLPSVPGIDAAIFATDLSLTPESVGSLPDTVEISIQVRNLGDQPVSDLSVDLLENDVSLQQASISLNSADSHEVMFELPLDAPPTDTYAIVLDQAGQITEANENNNRLEFSIPFNDGIDLVVTAMDIQVNPDPPLAGSDSIVQVTFRNAGTTAAPAATVVITEQFGGGSRVLLTTSVQLEAGASDARSVSWRPPQPGEYQLSAQIDTDNSVAETDEDNNVAQTMFTALDASDPNLLIMDFSAMPNPALEGMPITLVGNILNTGAAITADIQYTLFEGDPANSGSVLSSGQVAGGLGTQQTAAISFTSPAIVGQADRIYVLRLDPDNLLAETDETDNDVFIDVVIDSLPDLQITPAGISLSPAAPVPGQQVTASINVSNPGQQAAGPFAIRMEQSGSDGIFTTVGPDLPVMNLAGGTSSIEQITWTWPATGTITQVRATLDSNSEVIESNETNNQAIRNVTTQPGNLYLSEQFISPDGNGVKDTTTISFNIANPDLSRLEIINEANVVVQEFGPFTQASQSDVIWDGRDQRGRIVNDGDFSVRLYSNSELVGNSFVVVDTNRYPLYRATSEGREYIQPLSCEVQSWNNDQSYSRFSIDGDFLYLSGPRELISNETVRGIYRVPTLGRGIEAVVSEQWLDDLAVNLGMNGFNEYQEINDYFVLDNGDLVFMTFSETESPASQCDMDCVNFWVLQQGQIIPRQLQYPGSRFAITIDTVSNSHVLVYGSDTGGLPDNNGSFYLIDLNGINPARLVTMPALSGNSDFAYIADNSSGFIVTDNYGFGSSDLPPVIDDTARYWFVPFSAASTFEELVSINGNYSETHAVSNDGRYLSILVENSTALVEIYNLNNEITNPLVLDLDNFGDANLLRLEWSPGLNHLYVVNQLNGKIRQYDTSGFLLHEYEPAAEILDQLVAENDTGCEMDDELFTYLPKQSIRIPPFSSRNNNRPRAYVRDQSVMTFSPDGEFAWLRLGMIDFFVGEGVDGRGDDGGGGGSNNCNTSSIFAVAPFQLDVMNQNLDHFAEYENFEVGEWLLPQAGLVNNNTARSEFQSENVLEIAPFQNYSSIYNFAIEDIYPRNPGLAASQFVLNPISPLPELEDCDLATTSGEWSMHSLDNELVHLEATFDSGLYELAGIAADRDLDHYLIEFSSTDQPGVWTTLLPPQSVEVVDEVFTYWAPEDPGIYRVRLTVVDRAGNRKTDIISIAAADSASIGSISGSPRYISPNGDGIQDDYLLEFRVFQPLHLDILISDSSGLPVRSFSQDIVSPTGELMQFIWDGRDDAGQVVADGAYRASVNGRVLTLTVDNVSPEINPELSVEESATALMASISADFIDSNIESAMLEVRLAGDSEWLLVQQQSLLSGDDMQSSANFGLFDMDFVVGNEFRITAMDKAGNTNSSVLSPIQPEIHLLSMRQFIGLAEQGADEFGILDSLELPPTAEQAGLLVAHTIEQPLNSISLEFSEVTEPTIPPTEPQWFDAPLNQQNQLALEAGELSLLYPEGTEPYWLFQRLLVWDDSDYPQLFQYRLRIRAVGLDGTNYLSEAFTLRPGFDANNIENEPLPGSLKSSLLQQAVANLPEVDQDSVRFWFYGNSFFTRAQAINLSASSEADPRYLTPVRLQPVTIKYTKIADIEHFMAIFDMPLACHDAEGTYSATVQSADLRFRTVPLNRLLENPDCSGFIIDVTPMLQQQCDSPPLNQISVVIAESEAREGGFLPVIPAPDALIYEIVNPVTGAVQTLFSDTSPSGISFQTLGTSQLPEGSHLLRVTMITADGRHLQRVTQIIIQHDLQADFMIFQPDIGDQLCANIIADDDNNFKIVFNGEGAIQGVGPHTYRFAVSPIASSNFNNDDSGPLNKLNNRSGKVEFPITNFQGQFDKVLRDPEIFSTSIESKAVLGVSNWSGALQCMTHPFTVDSFADSTTPSQINALFSPNGDGNFDETRVDLFAAEPLFVNVDIYQDAGGSNSLPTPLGPPLERLVENDLTNGAYSYTWNGSGAAGLYTDGRYTLRFTLTDQCGNQRIADVVVTIDTTAPQVVIDFPQSGSSLTTIIEVLGSVVDDNLAFYELSFRESGSGSSVLLASDDTNVVSDYLGSWNLSGLLGIYELTLMAADQVGNSAFTTVALDINELGELILGWSAQPRLFSPNGDGQRDNSVLTLGLLAEADTDIVIMDLGGAPVRNLLSNTRLTSGSYQYSWDGLGNDAIVVPDGSYIATVNASDAGLLQQESVSLTVDNTPPVIELLNPQAGFSDGTGAVTVLLEDQHFHEYQIYHSSQPGTPADNLILQGEQAGTYDALDTTTLAEGEYQIRVIATDHAGNESEFNSSYILDRTPPQADLLEPVADAYLSGLEGNVTIRGLVADEYFAEYAIEILPENSNEPWQPLLMTDQLPDTDMLFDWDVAVPDGNYGLRLRVTDQAGNQSIDAISVTIDNTPPEVAMTMPAEGDTIAPGTEVFGSVSDVNLRRYLVSLSPANRDPPVWSDFIVGDESVVDDVLGTFGNLPPDGDYVMRLLAEDLAGNTGVIIQSVSSDSVPPPAPQNLIANVQGSGQVQLQWSAVAAADLAGYQIFRDGAQLTLDVITAAQYTDSNVPDGEHSYFVVALDTAGNISQPSNTVNVEIDTTAPTAILLSPINESRHAGGVDVRVTAFGDDDLASYQLYLAADGQPLPGELLLQSGVAVNATVVYQLDTTALVSDSNYIITLIAEDFTGNQAQVDATITIDNTPPAAPTGLVADLDNPGSNNATISWQPNTEMDLLGYLLLRNGEFVNGPAPSPDLRPLALTDSNYADPGLPDGEHRYVVLAIDTAGNVSAASDAASISVDLRAPELSISRPQNGEQFDGVLAVIAESDDLDIAEVVFEYRSTDSGTGAWLPLSNDTQSPFESVIDPDGLALDRGMYQLRAIATDQGGLTDPSPPQVTIEYRDLTPPPPVTQVTARADGGDAIVSWEVVDADDLAGYLVDRIQGGITERITASPVSATELTDSNLVDGSYSYQIIAVDANDNEAAASPVAAVQILTPILDSVPPLTADSSISMSGTVADLDSALAMAELTLMPSGYTDIQPLQSDSGFDFIDIPLGAGDNTVVVVVRYAGDSVSKPAQQAVTLAQAPSAPTGLMAEVDGSQVSANWNSNPEPDIAGYQVYVDNTPQLSTSEVSGSVADASVNTATAGNALDNNTSSFWEVPGSSLADGITQTIRFTMPQTEIVSRVVLTWRRFTAYPPQRVQVQAWLNGTWLTVADKPGTISSTQSINLDQPIGTDQIRLVLAGPPQTSNVVRLYEVDIRRQNLVELPTYIDDLFSGQYQLAVSAFNQLGLESELSESVEIVVGDFTAPAPVTLSAQVIDNTVQLDWGASMAGDLSHYLVYRDAVEIANIPAPDTTFSDLNLAGGDYSYHVTVVDATGNESEPSNTVMVTIEAELPEPPSNLSVIAPPNGNLELLWTASTSPQVTSYRVSRSIQDGGPYALQGMVAAPQTQFVDENVSVGQTYFYVAQAVDSVGNVSELSNQATGTLVDSVAPQPPVITSPTVAGRPISVISPIININGIAEPGVRVDLQNNDQFVGSTTARTEFSAIESDLINGLNDDGGDISPDGRWLFESGSTDRIVGLETDAILELPTSFEFGHWSEDSQIFYVRSDDRSEILAFDIATEQVAVIYNDIEINAFALSADESLLFVAGIRDTDTAMLEGAWITDLNTSVITDVPDIGRFSVNRLTVRWSPDGDYIGFVYTESGSELRIVNLLGETQLSLPVSSSIFAAPAWHPDSDILVTLVRNDQFRDQVTLLSEPFASAVPETLSFDSSNRYSRPDWSPDGRQLVWLRDFQAAEIVDFAAREVLVSIDPSGFSFASLRWITSGRVRAVDSDRRLDIVGPGAFNFDQVSLNPGNNQFIAFALDASGNQSFGSAPIDVEYAPVDLPDLVLQSLTALPDIAAPGQTIDASVLIANQGLVAADGVLAARIVDSLDTTVVQLPPEFIGTIAAGEDISGTFEVTLPDQSGAYRLIATVDPDGQITELDETNNTAAVDLTVVDDGPPQLMVELEQDLLNAGQTLSGNAAVFNPGNPVDLELQLRIEDSNAVPVADLPVIAIEDLGFGESRMLPFGWDSMQTFAGDYQLRAQLLETTGELIREQLLPFSLIDNAQLTLAVSTDQAQYENDATVQITSIVDYVQGTTPIAGGQVRLHALNSTGVEVFSAMLEPGTLLPGDQISMIEAWSLNSIEADNYTITSELFVAGELQASAQTAILVEPAAVAQSVQGTLGLATVTVAHGNAIQSSYTVTNTGTTAVQGNVVLVLLATGTDTVLAVQAVPFDLAASASLSDSHDFTSTAFSPGAYSILLRIQTDAGNSLLDVVNFSVVDATAPIITLVTPALDAVIAAPVLISAQVVDELSALNTVQVSVDGNAPRTMSAGVNGAFSSNFNLPDGDHLFTITATDTANNTATADGNFIVDSLVPVITITGVSDGMVTDQPPVTPIISITDEYLQASSILLNSQPYVSGTPITDDGDYSLFVSAVDEAGNSASEVVSFTIDMLGPEIVLVSPQAGSVINAPNADIIAQTEADTLATLLDNAGSSFQQTADSSGVVTFSDITLAEGENNLSLQAVDAAGNLGPLNSFTLTRGNLTADISGSLQIPVLNIIQPDPLAVIYRVNNTGDVALTDLPIRVDLQRDTGQVIVSCYLRTAAIAVGESFSERLLFDSVSLTSGAYTVTLQAELASDDIRALANEQITINVGEPTQFIDGFEGLIFSQPDQCNGMRTPQQTGTEGS